MRTRLDRPAMIKLLERGIADPRVKPRTRIKARRAARLLRKTGAPEVPTAGTKGAARAARDLALRGHALPRPVSPLAAAATIAGGVQMGRQITEDEETLRLYEAARRAGYRP